MSTIGRVGMTLAVTAFMGLMFAIVPGAIFPGSLRFLSPLVCPEGTARAVVVRTVTHPAPGETNISGELICISAQGRPERPGFLRTAGTLFGLCALLSLVLCLPILLRSGSPGRDSGGGLRR